MKKVNLAEYRESLKDTASFGPWMEAGKDKTWKPRGLSEPVLIAVHAAIAGFTAPKAYADWKNRNIPETFATKGQEMAWKSRQGNTMQISSSMVKLALAGFLERYKEGKKVEYRPGPRFMELIEHAEKEGLAGKVDMLEVFALRLQMESLKAA